MSLIDKINDIRNQVVAARSKVHAQNGSDVRAIKNGSDRYVVEKSRSMKNSQYFGHGDPRVSDPTLANVDTVSFMARDNQGNKEVVTLEKREIIEEGSREINLCEIGFGESARWGIKLDDDTDINDINSVRYQLGKSKKTESKQIAHFIDKFVIVTPSERKSYKEYAAEMDKKERDVLEAQKAKERAALKSHRAEVKQVKEDAKAAVVKAAAAKKVREKFVGK